MENRIINWKEPLGDPACPYCYRWVLNLGLFALRLHLWVASDDARALHDHPYWFITFILKGSYEDVQEKQTEIMKPGTIRFRRASHRHTVKLLTPSCLSFLISGPPLRTWGFWPNGKFVRREKYFKLFGRHTCDK